MDKQLTLFDFSSPQAAASWGPIDDRVMGGISNSTFLYKDSSGALFSGEVSMEHGGGFASVRSGHLDLELTETYLMEDAEESLNVLRDLKALGVLLSIDDFGTGYSSLGYLRRLPIDALKVDRSFLAGVPGDEDRTTITNAIIALGRSLRLRVIAEGVESGHQLAFLRDQGCDAIQGYLVSRPVPAERFVEFLAAGYRYGTTA